jgi:transcriptional regulator
MESLLKAMLKEDLLIGDNTEVIKVIPAIEEGEQIYTVSVRDWDSNHDGGIEKTYKNSELLAFIYEQSKSED